MSDHGICQRRSFCCFRSPRSCLHRCDPAEKTWWLVLSRSVVSDSPQPRGLQPARLLCPWNPPGQYTGVSSRSLLQGIFPAQELNPRLLHCRQILCHGATWEVQEARILTSFCTQAPAAPQTSCYCWRLRVTPPRRDPAPGWAAPRPVGTGDRALLEARVLRTCVHVLDLNFRCHSGVCGPRLSPKPRPTSGRQWTGFRPPRWPRAAASACVPRSHPPVAPCPLEPRASCQPGQRADLAVGHRLCLCFRLQVSMWEDF